MNDQTAEIGHNKGPEMTPERAALQKEYDYLMKAGTAWHDQVKAITDQETSGLAGNLIDRMATFVKSVNANKAEERKPTVDTQNEIKTFHEGLVAPLRAVKGHVGGLRTTFLKEEDRKLKVEKDRIAAEAREAERLAEEARKKADEGGTLAEKQEAENLTKTAKAATKTAKKTAKKTAGSKGSMQGKTSSLRTTYSAVITDQDAAYQHYRDHPGVVAALQTAADQTARSPDARKASHGLKDIPGVELATKETAV